MSAAPPAGVRAGLALLRQPDFARLFSARFISSFGSAMAPVAMAFGVLDLTGSPAAMGMVVASQTAAQLAVQLFGGALADRGSRKAMMVGGDLVAAAAQVAMAVLLFRADSGLAPLMGLMALNGVAFAFLWPASMGLVPQVVARKDLQSANALLSLAQSGAFGLGGAAAGVIVAVSSASTAIAVDAATFVVSALLVLGIRPRPQERAEPSSLLLELRAGWKEFTSHRWLWTIVAQFAVLVAGWSGGFFIVGPVVADRALGGAASWGLVAGSFGAGLLAGGIVALRVHVREPMRVGVFCCLLLAAPLLLLSIPAPLLVVSLGAFAAGMGIELFSVMWMTALHTRVAPEALSRVSSYDILGSIALAPLGEALAGPLVEAFGTQLALWVGAALIILPTLVVLNVREVWRMPAVPTSDVSAPSPTS